MNPHRAAISDVLNGVLLTSAISVLWMLFTTDLLTQFNPFSIREVSWWQFVQALNG